MRKEDCVQIITRNARIFQPIFKYCFRLSTSNLIHIGENRQSDRCCENQILYWIYQIFSGVRFLMEKLTIWTSPIETKFPGVRQILISLFTSAELHTNLDLCTLPPYSTQSHAPPCQSSYALCSHASASNKGGSARAQTKKKSCSAVFVES